MTTPPRPLLPEVRSRQGVSENQRYAMLRLGLGCNVTCPFCNVPWESYDAPMRLSLTEIKAEIDRIAAEGCERMHISGGEPTIRPELPDVVAYARAKGMTHVELQTNGIQLKSQARVARLKEAGLTQAFVGLHSHIPKVHDFLVQSPGAFADCVEGVRNLAREGIEVTLNPVLTVVNFRTLTGFIEFIHGSLPGVAQVSLSVVQPHGRAARNKSLMPRYGELSPFVERAVERAEGLGVLVNNPFCGLPLCVGGWHKRLVRNVEYCEAEMGRVPGDGEKFHPEPCGSCGLSSHCGGVWKEYPSIHPVSDLRPIPREAKA